MKKIGIIICDRYKTCAGGKCFRSLKERAGGFARYEGEEIELEGAADSMVVTPFRVEETQVLHTGHPLNIDMSGDSQ